MMQEEWRAIFGYEDLYEASTHGRIRRIAPTPARLAGCVLRSKDNGSGYLQVRLYRGGVASDRYLHVVIAKTFLGPPPLGYEVNHIDRNRANCRVDNLEYVTHSQNEQHKPIANLPTATGHRNVHLNRASGRYRVRIWLSGRKSMSFGEFADLAEAIAVASNARRDLFTHSPDNREEG